MCFSAAPIQLKAIDYTPTSKSLSLHNRNCIAGTNRRPLSQMAKLNVPPVETNLRQELEQIVQQKYLRDDDRWSKTILPFLLSRLATIETQIRQSVTANAHTPSSDTYDDVTRKIERIRTHFTENFACGAPFTIFRIAEVVISYQESEYSLATVALAHKYLLALERLLCVQSKETAFESSYNSQKLQSREAIDGDAHGLSRDIKYTRLLWDDAPITDTIMVKTKDELLKKVAAAETPPADQEGTNEHTISTTLYVTENMKFDAEMKSSEDIAASVGLDNDRTIISEETTRSSDQEEVPDAMKVEALVDSIEPTIPNTEVPLTKRAKLDKALKNYCINSSSSTED